MGDLNTLQFDITNDFKMREFIEKQNGGVKNDFEPSILEHVDIAFKTLPILNDKIRYNIKLGIEIYKQLNIFYSKYTNEVINKNST